MLHWSDCWNRAWLWFTLGKCILSSNYWYPIYQKIATRSAIENGNKNHKLHEEKFKLLNMIRDIQLNFKFLNYFTFFSTIKYKSLYSRVPFMLVEFKSKTKRSSPEKHLYSFQFMTLNHICDLWGTAQQETCVGNHKTKCRREIWNPHTMPCEKSTSIHKCFKVMSSSPHVCQAHISRKTSQSRYFEKTPTIQRFSLTSSPYLLCEPEDYTLT